MNNPKIYLAVFLASVVVLIGLLKLLPEETPHTFTTMVIAQTFTQSLDGHRRYIQIETANNSLQLVQISPLIDCPVKSTVEVSVESNLLSNTKNYKLLHCYPAPIE